MRSGGPTRSWPFDSYFHRSEFVSYHAHYQSHADHLVKSNTLTVMTLHEHMQGSNHPVLTRFLNDILYECNVEVRDIFTFSHICPLFIFSFFSPTLRSGRTLLWPFHRSSISFLGMISSYHDIPSILPIRQVAIILLWLFYPSLLLSHFTNHSQSSAEHSQIKHGDPGDLLWTNAEKVVHSIMTFVHPSIFPHSSEADEPNEI